MNTKKDPRIYEYMYFEQLMDHVNHDPLIFFSEDIVFPKQLEIHLPSDHIKACNLACNYCAGHKFNKALGRWETKALKVLDKIKGQVPQHIYGGAYTEPLMNPYLTTFLAKTREYGNNFGIHTNGVNLKRLQEAFRFLDEIHALAEGDHTSYLSVSLDGAHSWGWGKVKGTKQTQWYWDIIDAIHEAVEIRERKGRGHAIRLGYLISNDTASPEQFGLIVNMAKELGVDSLRFSIPFAHYNQTFEEVREYKHKVEAPGERLFEEWLKPYVSESKDEKPYIFWNYPWFTDIDRFKFSHCIYGYFQLTMGADGFYYPCSTVATPTAKHLRLGAITSNTADFYDALSKAQSKNFNPQKMCFEYGLRCNRMGLECNTAYEEIINQ